MTTWRKVVCCFATVAGLSFGASADIVPAFEYIKDGLVAHWDAIDNAATGTHDPAAAKWVDKVGGVELVGAFTVGETTMAPSADITGIVTGLWGLNGYTVETLSYRTDGKGLANSGFITTPRITMGYTSNGPDTFCVSLASASNVSWMRYYFESDKPKQHALATRTASYLVGAAKASGQPVFYYDGVETASSRLEGWTGTWAQNDDVKVRQGTTYHSVRIYNCILSAEEVAYNAAIDKIRFRGADPADVQFPDGYRLNAQTGKPEVRATVNFDSTQGSVSVNGAAIATGAEFWVPFGETIELELTPAAGCFFSRWAGVPSTVNARSLKVSVPISSSTTISAVMVTSICYVKPTATGTGDGSSWANAMDWVKAYGAMADSESDCEFWLAGDVTIPDATVTANTKTFQGGVSVTVRGGFRGDETELSQRDTDSVSTVSGGIRTGATGNDAVFNGDGLYNIMNVSLPAGCTLSFERIRFDHAKQRAITKSGEGNISLTDCRLSCNGWGIGHNTSSASGCGLYSSGAGTVSVVNTLVDGNGPIHYDQNTPGGWGIYVSGATGVTIDNCNFVTNGIWLANKGNGWHNATKGYALYVINSPVVLSNTRFAGNISKPGTANNKAGGTVYLENAHGGSRIENCTFIGNQDLAGSSVSGTGGGICIVSMKNATDTLAVSGSTFAYNLTQSTGYGAGGLTVYKGAVTVADSTFYRNFLGRAGARGWGADISILADATLDISNSTLEGLDSRFASCVTPGSLTMDVATMRTDDPMLTTSVTDAEALVSFGTSHSYPQNAATYFKMAAFDATPISPRPVKPDVGEGNVLYVKADETGADDGSSWANAFTTLDKALAAVSPKKNEIWVAGGYSLAENPAWARIDDSVVVRGGFVGTESEAAARPAGAKSTIDGQNLYDVVLLSVKVDAKVTFENFIFSRGKTRAVRKCGLGDLAFVNCDILNSGRAVTADGHAVLAAGEAGIPSIAFTNCTVGGQMRDTSTTDSQSQGGALFVSNHKLLTIDETLFSSNGTKIASRNSRIGFILGSALYGYASPAKITRSRFAGNFNTHKAADANGGTVVLEGFLDGSEIVNCAFVGNQEARLDQNSNTRGGALTLIGSSGNQIKVENCTFAYNVSQGDKCASALTVRGGEVNVKNCIFWKNPHGQTAVNGYGCEIEAAGGTTHVSHSIVTSKEVAYCHGATESALDLDPDTVYTDDPSFVSSNEVFDAMFAASSGYLNPTAKYTIKSSASLDVHLLSPEQYFLNDGSVGPAADILSLAVDKGDPSSDYTKEPGRNGKRINLGAYGNTPKASQTPGGTPKADSFDVSYPDDETRPVATLVLGLKDGSGYSANVTLKCYLNEELVEEKTFEGVPNGNTVAWKVPKVFEPDQTGIKVTYSIDVVDAESATGELVSTTEGKHKPAYADKGGDPSTVIHVRAGADYKMDGTSWTDAFPDLKSAVDAMDENTEEIWIAGDIPAPNLSLTLTRPLAIRGGFAATEDSPAERPKDSRTLLDYANVSAGLVIDNTAAVTLDRLFIRRAKTRAVVKSNTGDLTLSGCRLSCNGQVIAKEDTISGRALKAAGGTAATVTITNCVIDGNMTTDYYRGEFAYNGGACFVDSCARLVVDDTLFASNGMQLANMSGSYYNYYGRLCGAALYANATPVVMRRSRIVANANGSHEGGSAVSLAGNCSGSAFTNCAFVGHFERQSSFDDSSSSKRHGGALTIELGGAAQTVDIEGCTFAYNTSAGRDTAAALNVLGGTVTVKDSIFWRNHRSRYVSDVYANDIEVKGGSCSVTHSAVTAKDVTSYRAGTSGNLSVDPNTVYAFDPLFVTSTEEFETLYTFSGSAVSPTAARTYPALAAIDVHLLSPQQYFLNDGSVGPATNAYSQAIDKGDPDADWSNEPTPNGSHVNLGAYGNTKEASSTSVGQPEVTSFEVLNPNGYARPEAHLRTGISSGSDYAATVTIVCTQGGVVIGRYEQKNVHNGDEVVWLLPRFVDAGAALVYSYTVEADGAETKEASKDVTAGDKYPDYYGKGGGANVIHVRAGADCEPTGEDWAYAYPDLASGVRAAEASGKGEIWVAMGDYTFAVECQFTNTVAIRGGFTGVECGAAARPDGTRTRLDNGGTGNGLVVSNGVGTVVTLERIELCTSQNRGLQQKGGGDLVIDSCRIANNARTTQTEGRGAYVNGGGTAHIAVSNSVIEGNMYQNTSDNICSGGGFYLLNCAEVVIDSCLFVTNGQKFVPPGDYPMNNLAGSAICASGSKVLCRNTKFMANASAGNTGGTVFLTGNGGGSRFENCVFAGNSYTPQRGGVETATVGGALAISLGSSTQTVEIWNCTFAHNVVRAKNLPGALTVNIGKVLACDCIFWKDLNGYEESDVEIAQGKLGAAHEIEVKASGSLVLTNTLIASTEWPYVHSANAANLSFGGTVLTNANPLFVTADGEVTSLIRKSGQLSYYVLDDISKLTSINVHLRGGSGYYDEATGEVVSAYRMPYEPGSPAIDKGRKMRKGLLEPHPNGNRVNLGAYGNTPWATMSKGGTLIFVR